MLAALPAPMRICYEVESKLPCPLTVREGRGWISDELEGQEITCHKLEEEETFEEAEDVYKRQAECRVSKIR